MFTRSALVGLLAAVCTLLATDGVADPVLGAAADATAWQNLTYAVVPGFGPLVMDLYVPASDNPVPVVVWVHGGGWMGGDKEPTPAVDLTHDGYAAASVQYRLSNEAQIPCSDSRCKGRHSLATCECRHVRPG
jgi:acetyl esterase/lipase